METPWYFRLRKSIASRAFHERENMDAENEQNLIERCRKGERDAQRLVFEQSSPRIYRLLLRMAGNEHDAADLAQETYVRGFERLNQFDGRSTLETWFYRIAVNEALQFRRRERIGIAKLQHLARSRPATSTAMKNALRLDLEHALGQLSADDQMVLLLRYQEELDYRRIAEILECAEGTVASKLNRARDRLREILRGGYE